MNFFDGVNPKSIAEAESGFMQFKVGDNEAYIKMVQEKTSGNGNEMLEITFATEDSAEIRHYIVNNEFKLQKLKQLYIAFDIPPKDYLNLRGWLYKEGIVVCKQGDPYNGTVYNKVSYLRPKVKQNSNPGPAKNPQSSRPPAQQHSVTEEQRDYTQEQGEPPVNDGFDDDIPF
jgi:hypothetical protein